MKPIGTLLLFLSMLSTAIAQNAPQATLDFDRPFYAEGEPVVVTVRNSSGSALYYSETMPYLVRKNGKVAYPQNEPLGDDIGFKSGSSRTIRWDGRNEEGRISGPGLHTIKVVLRTENGPEFSVEKDFHIVATDSARIVTRTTRASFRTGQPVSFFVLNRSILEEATLVCEDPYSVWRGGTLAREGGKIDGATILAPNGGRKMLTWDGKEKNKSAKPGAYEFKLELMVGVPQWDPTPVIRLVRFKITR